jgi:hypothetical protein
LVADRGEITDWDRLCELVFNKYDKDQYQTQLRQLEMLQQTGTVTEYQAQFEKLAHGVMLYNPTYDDVFFVTRFLAVLKEEIKSAITLHRPRDVDTASALALLQEEELGHARQKSFGRVTKGQDRAQTTDSDKIKNKAVRSESDDKLNSLKQFRRKHGLCFKCGGKWSTTHTCPEQVPLHVIEELLDALEVQSSEDSEELQSEIQLSEDGVMAVQSPDKEIKGHRQTLKLLASIGKQQVLVLVDSGSVGTFVSDRLVSTLCLTTT